MEIININNLENSKIEKSYIALGNFDGMHRAHTALIQNCVKRAKENGIKSSVLLFKEHTITVLKNEEFKVITTMKQKLDFMRELNVDLVYIVPFIKIKDLSPSDFICNFLINNLDVESIFVGYDYRFGKNATGNTELMKEVLKNTAVGLEIMDEFKYNGLHVSSSEIRRLIMMNELITAEELLGHEYWLEGEVVQGKKLGSKLGFPTANIVLMDSYILPSEGVYYTQIRINSKIYAAATSLGKNITLNENDLKIEAHILDFNMSIYGENLEIRFVKKIREMSKFTDLVQLKHQVLEDCITVNLLYTEELRGM